MAGLKEPGPTGHDVVFRRCLFAAAPDPEGWWQAQLGGRALPWQPWWRTEAPAGRPTDVGCAAAKDPASTHAAPELAVVGGRMAAVAKPLPRIVSLAQLLERMAMVSTSPSFLREARRFRPHNVTNQRSPRHPAFWLYSANLPTTASPWEEDDGPR